MTKMQDLTTSYSGKGLVIAMELPAKEEEEKKEQWLEVWPLLWGRATLQLITPAIDDTEPGRSPVMVLDQWEYDTRDAAIEAARTWRETGAQGEPDGWTRHPGSGRRRPGGRAEEEYVRL